LKNVILLTIDTLRKDAVGCYGGGSFTPFIDSIQDHCIRFTEAHSAGPYTRAAFPGILTSSYYLEDGMQQMLSEKKVLVSEVLRRAGIVTAAFHSNPFMCEDFGWNRGWDVFYDSMDEEVDDKVPYIKGREINRKVATWLSSHTGAGDSKPFFLWLHYMDIHEPYVPAQKYIDMVDPSMHLNEDEMFRLFPDVILKRDVSDKGTLEILKKLYHAHVREADDVVREFFGILEEKAVLDNSVVIITSDHGDEFGEHGGISHDGKMYSELVNVPLMLYEPDRKPGMVSDTLVTTLDIPPTIVYIFGLDPVEAFEGHSLIPLEAYPEKGVFGEAVDKHGSFEKGEEKEVHYYREGDLKIIYRERGDAWELYDLKSDPGETKNILGTSPQAEAMKQKIMPRVRRYQR
jgi:arylsulfatase A-like enzyme